MTQIIVICPSCGKKGKINVSEDLIKNTSRGILSVNIDPEIICSHTFLVYIDKNLQIRDYFFVDLKLKLPEIASIDKIEVDVRLSKEIVDIELIKLNISAMFLTYVIKSIFLKQKIVLVSDEEFLHKHIINFFQYLTQNNFELDLSVIKSDEYKNNKKSYENAMIFGSNKILKNNKNLINPKKLDIEKKIVARFFSEIQSAYSLIVLKNEIFKAFKLSKQMKEFVENEQESGNQANILKIQNELEKLNQTRIVNQYLQFLIDIVINYYKISMPSVIFGFFEFL
ncbi:MAG TPA: hypothetical protein VGB37_13465 [Candidatus Lokiarchaeia archaeon]